MLIKLFCDEFAYNFQFTLKQVSLKTKRNQSIGFTVMQIYISLQLKSFVSQYPDRIKFLFLGKKSF